MVYPANEVTVVGLRGTDAGTGAAVSDGCACDWSCDSGDETVGSTSVLISRSGGS